MDYSKLVWQSDWNGEEVGYDAVSVVGLYTLKGFPEMNVYIDVEKGIILEAFLDYEDEDE